MSRARARLLLPVVLCLALACGHGEPFGVPGQGTDQPFQPAAPTRLTFNPGVDRDPTWLPDGSGILYSGDRADRGGDRCLMLLPPAGGRVVRSICNDDPLAADSLKTYDAAAVSPGGQLALERASRPPSQFGATYDELAVGLLATAPAAATVLSLPFTMGSTLYTGVSQIRWLGENALVFRADFAGPVCIDAGVPCARAFVTSGLDLMVDTLGSSAPVRIPGTALASSVAVSPDGDTLFYTINGDSRVFRRALSAGAAGIMYDFGAGTVVRDVQVAGNRIAAVIGGSVTPLDAPGVGLLQWDRGGTLVVVDVPTRVVFTVTDPARSYRRLALAPDGRRVVAEANGDLWLFDLP